MATTPEVKKVAKARPGTKAGQSNEFTLICALKPGGAERMRKLLADGFTGERQKNTDRIATVHDLRFVIFQFQNNFFFDPDSDSIVKWMVVLVIIPDAAKAKLFEFSLGSSYRNGKIRLAVLSPKLVKRLR